MAKRPSPAAIKARQELEAERKAHAATLARLKVAEHARDALGQRMSDVERSTGESQSLAKELRDVQTELDAKSAEVGFLRSLLNRVTNGGVFVSGMIRA